MLNAMAGSDPADPWTKDADAHKTDYLAGLKPDALKGARIGVLRMTAGRSPQTDAVFEDALAALRKAGAVLVEVKGPDDAALSADLRQRGRGPARRVQGRAERLPRHHCRRRSRPAPSTT